MAKHASGKARILPPSPARTWRKQPLFTDSLGGIGSSGANLKQSPSFQDTEPKNRSVRRISLRIGHYFSAFLLFIPSSIGQCRLLKQTKTRHLFQGSFFPDKTFANAGNNPGLPPRSPGPCTSAAAPGQAPAAPRPPAPSGAGPRPPRAPARARSAQRRGLSTRQKVGLRRGPKIGATS